MLSRIVHLGRFAVLFTALLAVAGCGTGTTIVEPTIPPSESQRRLNAIGDAYLRATMRLNRPPKSVTEITPNLKEQGVNVDETLKSPDDGLPFEIVWGNELRSLKASGSEIPIIAFERKGKGGTRHVLRGRSEVLLMSESDLRSGKFPEGYKPPL